VVAKLLEQCLSCAEEHEDLQRHEGQVEDAFGEEITWTM